MGSNYAGVDWASEKHDVLIADATGEELLAATFAHDEAGLRALCRALVRYEVTLVAIERPDGLLVERLLDAYLSQVPPRQGSYAKGADPAGDHIREGEPDRSTRRSAGCLIDGIVWPPCACILPGQRGVRVFLAPLVNL